MTLQLANSNSSRSTLMTSIALPFTLMVSQPPLVKTDVYLFAIYGMVSLATEELLSKDKELFVIFSRLPLAHPVTDLPLLTSLMITTQPFITPTQKHLSARARVIEVQSATWPSRMKMFLSQQDLVILKNGRLMWEVTLNLGLVLLEKMIPGMQAVSSTDLYALQATFQVNFTNGMAQLSRVSLKKSTSVLLNQLQ